MKRFVGRKLQLPRVRGRCGRGYTLLEVLLATALCSVLLAALWTLMSTFGDLFDKGQQQVERAQLCRALLEQMAEDLRSAIQDPLPGTANETAGTGQRRRFGLYGSSRELRFDVLQITPQQANLVPVGRTARRSDEAPAARVPELRTVHYAFFEPSAGDELSDLNQQGLVRTELDFETPLEDAAASGSEADGSPASRGPADTGTDSSAGGADGNLDPEAAFDDTRLDVPEVVSLQFRYFDGRGWTDSWNSLDRKSLPAAVEIQLQLADSTPDSGRRRPGANIRQPDAEFGDAADASEDDLSAAETGLEPAGSPPAGAAYSLIVDLPGSPNYRPPAIESEPATTPRLVRPPVRRSAPPRRTRPTEPAPLPEDWLRTGSR